MKNAARQSDGRFGDGNTIGGRPPGARAQFCETFIEDYRDVWLEHGKAALEKVAKSQPLEFLKAAIALQPKDVEIRTDALPIMEISFLGFEEDDVIEGELDDPNEDVFAVATNADDSSNELSQIS